MWMHNRIKGVWDAVEGKSLCENCFLMLILSSHVYWMSFMMILCVEEWSVSATLCCLRACNVIKKFDFGNLISSPTPCNVMHTNIHESCKDKFCGEAKDEFFISVTNWQIIHKSSVNTFNLYLCDLNFSPLSSRNIYVKHFTRLHSLAFCKTTTIVCLSLGTFFALRDSLYKTCIAWIVDLCRT